VITRKGFTEEWEEIAEDEAFYIVEHDTDDAGQLLAWRFYKRTAVAEFNPNHDEQEEAAR
jgi:hypothetical protein